MLPIAVRLTVYANVVGVKLEAQFPDVLWGPALPTAPNLRVDVPAVARVFVPLFGTVGDLPDVSRRPSLVPSDVGPLTAPSHCIIHLIQ